MEYEAFHNWNCPGNCRQQVQCELDACWQRLEEALEWDNLKRAEVKAIECLEEEE